MIAKGASRPGSWRLILVGAAFVAGGCGGGSPAGPSGGGTGGPGGGQPADVIAVGDIGWCGSSGTPAVAQLVDSLPGRLLLAGDIAYPSGSAQDFQRCFDPAWGRFRGRWHAVPGNHDYLTPNASAYFDYFGPAAGPDRTGYYTLAVGDWQILMLDSNVPTERNSAQWEFVRRELDLHRRPCTLAVWHHPLFSSGQNGPNLYMRDMYALLEAGTVDVLVTGHDHLYERFAKQTADGRPSERGVRAFVVGTGGAELYRFVTAAPNSESRIAQFGALHLSLQPAGYRWEFVLANGGLADSGNDTCH
jgi:calcineurin-like phosphoesterase family protein